MRIMFLHHILCILACLETLQCFNALFVVHAGTPSCQPSGVVQDQIVGPCSAVHLENVTIRTSLWLNISAVRDDEAVRSLTLVNSVIPAGPQGNFFLGIGGLLNPPPPDGNPAKIIIQNVTGAFALVAEGWFPAGSVVMVVDCQMKAFEVRIPGVGPGPWRAVVWTASMGANSRVEFINSEISDSSDSSVLVSTGRPSGAGDVLGLFNNVSVTFEDVKFVGRGKLISITTFLLSGNSKLEMIRCNTTNLQEDIFKIESLTIWGGSSWIIKDCRFVTVSGSALSLGSGPGAGTFELDFNSSFVIKRTSFLGNAQSVSTFSLKSGASITNGSAWIIDSVTLTQLSGNCIDTNAIVFVNESSQVHVLNVTFTCLRSWNFANTLSINSRSSWRMDGTNASSSQSTINTVFASVQVTIFSSFVWIHGRVVSGIGGDGKAVQIGAIVVSNSSAIVWRNVTLLGYSFALFVNGLMVVNASSFIFDACLFSASSFVSYGVQLGGSSSDNVVVAENSALVVQNCSFNAVSSYAFSVTASCSLSNHSWFLLRANNFSCIDSTVRVTGLTSTGVTDATSNVSMIGNTLFPSQANKAFTQWKIGEGFLFFRCNQVLHALATSKTDVSVVINAEQFFPSDCVAQCTLVEESCFARNVVESLTENFVHAPPCDSCLCATGVAYAACAPYLGALLEIPATREPSSTVPPPTSTTAPVTTAVPATTVDTTNPPTTDPLTTLPPLNTQAPLQTFQPTAAPPPAPPEVTQTRHGSSFSISGSPSRTFVSPTKSDSFYASQTHSVSCSTMSKNASSRSISRKVSVTLSRHASHTDSLTYSRNASHTSKLEATYSSSHQGTRSSTQQDAAQPSTLGTVEQAAQDTARGVVIATAITSSPTSAVSMARVASMQAVLSCELELDVSDAVNLLALTFGPEEGEQARGAIVGNTLIAASCLFVLGICVSTIVVHSRVVRSVNHRTVKKAMAMVRFPGVMAIPMAAVLQPTLASSVALLSVNEWVGDVPLGVLGMALCVGFALWVLQVVVWRFPCTLIKHAKREERLAALRDKGGLRLFFFRLVVAPHRWSCDVDPHWRQRHVLVFEDVRAPWYIALDTCASVVVGVATGLPKSSTSVCVGQAAVFFIVYALLLGAMWFRPMLQRIMTIFCLLMNGVGFVGASALVVYAIDKEAFPAGSIVVGTCALIMSFLAIVKTFTDLLEILIGMHVKLKKLSSYWALRGNSNFSALTVNDGNDGALGEGFMLHEDSTVHLSGRSPSPNGNDVDDEDDFQEYLAPLPSSCQPSSDTIAGLLDVEMTGLPQNILASVPSTSIAPSSPVALDSPGFMTANDHANVGREDLLLAYDSLLAPEAIDQPSSE